MKEKAINEIFSQNSELIIIDSEYFLNNLSLIKFLPYLSKHFSEISLYSKPLFIHFYNKVLQHMDFIKVIPHQQFEPDYSKHGIILDLSYSEKETRKKHYRVFSPFKKSEIEIINPHSECKEDEESVNPIIDCMIMNLCLFLNIKMDGLDRFLEKQMINYYYPTEHKTTEIVLLLRNPIKRFLTQYFLKSKGIRTINLYKKKSALTISKSTKDFVNDFFALSSHYYPEHLDFDSFLILLKNASELYTDDADYFAYFKKSVFQIDCKKISMLSIIELIFQKKQKE